MGKALPLLGGFDAMNQVITAIEKPKFSHSASKGITHSCPRVQKLRMESQVIFHKRGNREVTVIVSRLSAQL